MRRELTAVRILVFGLLVLSACSTYHATEGATGGPPRPFLAANELGDGSIVSPTLPPSMVPRTVEGPAATTPAPFAPTAALPATKEALVLPQDGQAGATAAPTVGQHQTESPLLIHAFEILEAQSLSTGKQITLRWSYAGASARIVSGTKRRMQDWWIVPPSGTLTVTVASTVYRDPAFALHVYSLPLPEGIQSGQMVSASVGIPWPCEPDYFFANSLRRCPLGPPVTSWAAEQPFEGGWMLWLETEQSIYVLVADGDGGADSSNGRFLRYADTWTEDEPSHDPSRAAPPGFHQPIRGFGKVWREDPAVQGVLGWAAAPESGYETVCQQAHHEGSSSGAPRYVRRRDGRIIWLFGDRSGTWGYVDG